MTPGPLISLKRPIVGALYRPRLPGGTTVPMLAPERPSTETRHHEKYDRLIAAAQALPKLKVAVVHPCDEASLGAALEAATLGLIEPILVGPPGKIDATAAALGADITAYRRVEAAHSHDAAAKAVALVRAGQAEALMKGSLHTDELMRAVRRRETGLRTERRISHCLRHGRAGLSPTPLHHHRRRDQHRADARGQSATSCRTRSTSRTPWLFRKCRVAILSAVETVNPKMPSTIEAAALCKMADRGQITGALLDGPLAFDNAIGPEAARDQGDRSRRSPGGRTSWWCPTSKPATCWPRA